MKTGKKESRNQGIKESRGDNENTYVIISHHAKLNSNNMCTMMCRRRQRVHWARIGSRRPMDSQQMDSQFSSCTQCRSNPVRSDKTDKLKTTCNARLKQLVHHKHLCTTTCRRHHGTGVTAQCGMWPDPLQSDPPQSDPQ